MLYFITLLLNPTNPKHLAASLALYASPKTIIIALYIINVQSILIKKGWLQGGANPPGPGPLGPTTIYQFM